MPDPSQTLSRIGFVPRSAVKDAATLKIFHAGNVVHAVPLDAGSKQNCAGLDAVGAIKPHAVARLRDLKRFDVPSNSGIAEPQVPFLYRLFRSGQKHLQAELHCLCLNRFHNGSEAIVIELECRSEVCRVFLQSIG